MTTLADLTAEDREVLTEACSCFIDYLQMGRGPVPYPSPLWNWKVAIVSLEKVMSIVTGIDDYSF